MKADIHPEYVLTNVTCSCGNSFQTRSTSKSGQIHADVCSECHPFYTGKQKILDTGGRVAKFEKRFGKQAQLYKQVSALSKWQRWHLFIFPHIKQQSAKVPIKLSRSK